MNESWSDRFPKCSQNALLSQHNGSYRVSLTVFLKSRHSSGVSVSDLAISGMMLTLSCNRFINSMSNGFKL